MIRIQPITQANFKFYYYHNYSNDPHDDNFDNDHHDDNYVMAMNLPTLWGEVRKQGDSNGYLYSSSVPFQFGINNNHITKIHTNSVSLYLLTIRLIPTQNL